MIAKLALPLIALTAVGLFSFSAVNANKDSQQKKGQDDPSKTIYLAKTDYQPATDIQPERAILAGGCFWGIEFYFRKVPGVMGTAVGYIGGKTEHPTYKQVCYENTGHAEAIIIEYDPSRISYKEILDQFWQVHNPCTLNRQGPDVGSQYRSAIFYLNDSQKKVALESKKEAGELFTKEIVTEITKAPKFYMAEDYHQQYAQKVGKASCPIDRSNHIDKD